MSEYREEARSAAEAVEKQAPRALRVIDRVLTRDRMTVYPGAALLFFGASVLWLVTTRGVRPLPDFAARWTAGYMLVRGEAGQLYDPAVQLQVQLDHMPGDDLSLFVSPPFAALVFAPLGLLPYAMACLLWGAASLASLIVAIKLLQCMAAKGSPLTGQRALLPLLASYPVFELLGGGQDSSFILLAVVGGIWLIKNDRDLLAGAFFAVGLIKPHLVIAVPFALLIIGRMRALLSFALVGSIFAGLSLGVVGWDGCVRWLSVVLGNGYSDLVQRGQAWKSASLPGLAHAVMPPGSSRAWELGALIAGLAIVAASLLILARRRHVVRPLPFWGFVMAAACLAAPHLLVYDLVLLIPALFALGEIAWDVTTRAVLTIYTLSLFMVAPVHVLTDGLSWPGTLIGAPWHVLLLLWVWNALRQRLEPSPGPRRLDT